MNVYITVDTEVWPVNRSGWPHRPLPKDYFCEREVDAYLHGKTRHGDFGVPFQLAMLRDHGLQATYFVDPMFSFAIGIEPLRSITQLIEGAGQRTALHLHPEWLTDPRVEGLPGFRGPYISQYEVDDQRMLIRAGLQRLRDAGVSPLLAFRAGSWGADVSTLEALREEGISVDSSLNAAYPVSLPALKERDRMQEAQLVDGVLEFPVTRFDDRISSRGRPLSVVGTSWAEMHFVLEECLEARRGSLVIVLHSNEFVKTERLAAGRAPLPRRVAERRFRRLCRYLETNRERIRCLSLPDYVDSDAVDSAFPSLPRSSLVRTSARLFSQFLARWY